VRSKILERDVHATSFEIAANVAKDVRELQGNSEIRRVLA
jgi:hypothetical protein